MTGQDSRAERMHINPSHVSVAMFLGGALTFEVPRYQRHYAWKEKEIATFIRDLELSRAARENRRPRDHFLGGVVTARAPIQGSTRQNLQVIDGQQRLATFMILILQLATAMSKLATGLENEDAEVAKFLAARAKILRERYEAFQDAINMHVIHVPRLTLSVPDNDFFLALLRAEQPEATRRSHQLLRSAFDAIGDYFDGVVQGKATPPEKAQALDLVHEVLEQDWTLIHMGAESRTSAYMLYQVLNDRGVGLTEGELMRASTLEALEPHLPVQQMRLAEEAWDAMLAESAIEVRRALQWIFASHFGRSAGPATLLTEFQEAMFPMLRDDGINADDAASLAKSVADLRDEFAKLERIADGEMPFEGANNVCTWERDRLRLLILHLKQGDCIPLLLAASLLSAGEFSEIVQILERFCFRYVLLAEGPRSESISIFDKHSLEIRRNPAAYNVASLTADLRSLVDLHASDEVFEARLRTFGYPRAESRKPLKYFLMTIEHFIRWYDEGAQGKPRCRDLLRIFDFENGTIEHVYAENSAQSDPALEPLLDTLGNLTFLSPAENDAAGAKPFEQKKLHLGKSTTELNRKIAAEADWTAAVVRRRHDRLIEIALKVFRI